MMCFAHSAGDGHKEQTYEEHVLNVRALANKYALEAGKYCADDSALLTQSVENAAECHDMGKLDKKNQDVLSGKISAKSLPINHVDAGAAYRLNVQPYSALAAAAIQAHHIGFPDFTAEMNKEYLAFRDIEIAAEIDEKLPEYTQMHEKLVGKISTANSNEDIKGDLSIFLRMLLSCVADADHTDTARHYGKYPESENNVPLKPTERLEKLNKYIADLQKNGSNTERNRLRSEMYYSCRDFENNSGIGSCDCPVGSGKTTAVMAHLLSQAQKRGLRRIFVVLPFTNIIQQSVKKYREILTLDGENPNEVVAELHHRADFENDDLRHLTALWRAPIIVTTAVAFFETLASDSPAALRRLHELPGSAVFVDESHAALPASLLPVAWKWMCRYSDEWNCYWVLASGSANRFWTINEISGNHHYFVPEISDSIIRNKLSAYENNRITYRYNPQPKTTSDLAAWITTFKGPRLIIMNTVQSAAVLANYLSKNYGREKVEHLSTALTSSDREATLERIKSRLKDKSDTDWTLVATSCIEAGVDISFHIGFRELGSLSSLLQTAGRINREGDEEYSELWTFLIAEDGLLKNNPSLKQSGEVLKHYFESGTDISAQLVTQSISDEIKLCGLNGKHKNLVENEENQDFRYVEQHFKVIDSDTRIAVVDDSLANKIRYNGANWTELQKHSIQIAKYKLDELSVPQIKKDIYFWNLKYDSFIGYMAGVIEYYNLDGKALIF